ncbi:MAG: type II toxin-antitoxin system VapC family toxin [Thermoproteota archaeon]|jgi:predicted nucleic acid-binding protein
MYVLDSSAIAIILRRFKEKSIELLEGRITLDLALYELGNVMWKEHMVEKLISEEEAVSKVGNLSNILETMEVEKITSSEDLRSIMRLAIEQKLTFYDSSYLYIAKTKKAILVTEDNELIEKAKQADVKVERVNEYATPFLNQY